MNPFEVERLVGGDPRAADQAQPEHGERILPDRLRARGGRAGRCGRGGRRAIGAGRAADRALRSPGLGRAGLGWRLDLRRQPSSRASLIELGHGPRASAVPESISTAMAFRGAASRRGRPVPCLRSPDPSTPLAPCSGRSRRPARRRRADPRPRSETPSTPRGTLLPRAGPGRARARSRGRGRSAASATRCPARGTQGAVEILRLKAPSAADELDVAAAHSRAVSLSPGPTPTRANPRPIS